MGNLQDEGVNTNTKELDDILAGDELDYIGTKRTWGTPESDLVLAPMQDYYYTIIAGTQGSGKTAYCFNLAEENTKISGLRVLFYSLEMSEDQIIMRNARNSAGITKEQWRDKTLISDAQKIKYRKRKQEILDNKLLLLVGAGEWEDKSIEHIMSDALQFGGVTMIIIDNLDLIHMEGALGNNQRQEYISRYLLQWTNEYQVPVVLVHHMRKDGKGIDGIRGSGKLSDDADLVLMISRPAGEGLSDAEKRATDILCPKDRDWGEFIAKRLYFNKGKFEDTFEGMIDGFIHF